jgi:hypothetical protein
MKTFRTFLKEEDLKVGDRIRTKKLGIPGIITKIEGDKVSFDHATDKYDTQWSGAKDQPKTYETFKSDVIKESFIKEAMEIYDRGKYILIIPNGDNSKIEDIKSHGGKWDAINKWFTLFKAGNEDFIRTFGQIDEVIRKQGSQYTFKNKGK